MNKVVLMGRLTKDPDVRYTQGENSMAVAHYTLAVDRRRGRNNQQDGQPTADFIPCTAFGKPAEFAEKYFHKGIKICISGRIQTGSYTNKDGVRVYTTDVIVEDQEFAESKNSQNGGGADYNGFGGYGSNGGNNGYSGNGYNSGSANGNGGYGSSYNAPAGNGRGNYSNAGANGAGSSQNGYPQQPGSGNGNNGNGQQPGSPAPQSSGQEQPSGAIDGFMNIPDGIDEELPFN